MSFRDFQPRAGISSSLRQNSTSHVGVKAPVQRCDLHKLDSRSQFRQGSPKNGYSTNASTQKELTGIDRFRQKYGDKYSNLPIIQGNQNNLTEMKMQREIVGNRFPEKRGDEENDSRNKIINGTITRNNFGSSKTSNNLFFTPRTSECFHFLSEEISIYQVSAERAILHNTYIMHLLKNMCNL